MTVKYFTDEFKFVGSSALEKAWYDKETGDLFVKFRSTNIAGYKNVPPSTWHAFRSALSAGSYYTSNIKFVYKGQNSDVELVERPYPAADMTANPAAEVGTYEIVYSATFTSRIFAVGMEDALRQLTELVDKASGIKDFKIKSVATVE